MVPKLPPACKRKVEPLIGWLEDFWAGCRALLGLDGPEARHHTGRATAKIESPEVMLNSFLSASSSRLDPC